jgi:uncharacterized protein YggE
LTVVLRDLAKSGAVISAAESTSGNDVAISDINYSVTHTSPSEAAARAAAMRDALARARGLASAASESVGAIVKITDNSAPQPPEPFVRFGTAVGAGKAPSSVPLQPGTQTVTANIDVTFDLMA